MKNIYGGGATTNKNGLNFEEKTSLKNKIENNENYKLEKHQVFNKKDNLIGLYLPKYQLYKEYLDKEHIAYKNILSKKILPD